MTALSAFPALVLGLSCMTLLLCASCQTLHGYLRYHHRIHSAQPAVVAYEVAILVHMLLLIGCSFGALGMASSSALNASAARGAGAGAWLGFGESALLWANAAVALIALYTAIGGFGAQDAADSEDDPKSMAGLETLLCALCTPPAIDLLGPTWAYVFFLDVAYLAFRSVFLLMRDRSIHRHTLSLLTLVESIKYLPEGILYADNQGKTLMANDAMRSCLTSLGLSSDIDNIDELWEDIAQRGRSEQHAVELGEDFGRDFDTWVAISTDAGERGAQFRQATQPSSAQSRSHARGSEKPDADFALETPVEHASQQRVWLFSRENSTDASNRHDTAARPLAGNPARLDDVRQVIGSVPRYRLMAYDITNEVELARETARVNEQLAQTQRELLAAVDEAREASENDALLRMRGRVHDVIGQRLSMLHRALEDDRLSDDMLEKMKPLLNGILDELSAETALEPQDELAATIDAFALTGVDIELVGTLPADRDTVKLFADCIREAATNAMKHGNAHRVEAVVGETTLAIANDGAPPVAPIVEGTGLTNMRRAVAQRGGTLDVVIGERFELRVSLGA